jgi:hypothetical protein
MSEIKQILEEFYNNRLSYEYPLYQCRNFIGANFESILKVIESKSLEPSIRANFLTEATTVDNQFIYGDCDEYDLLVANDFFKIIKKISDLI